jgi:L-fucose isomerase-like protein
MIIKPVFILSRGVGISIKPTGQLQSIKDREEIRGRINFSLEELKSELGDGITISEQFLVNDPADLNSLLSTKDETGALLVYFWGITPIENLLRWPGPIIAFGGQHTPAFPLYAVGEERHFRKDLFIALDYEDIRRTLRILELKRSLAQTRVVMVGSPASWYLRWYAFPDLEALRRKFGLQFIPLELRELLEVVKGVDKGKASSLARRWMDEAKKVVGPSVEDVQQSAVAYLALEEVLTRRGAGAMAINCLEITQSRKFSDQITNPCMAMSWLRDMGIPSACEMDIAALVTMILLGTLSKKPTFLGNIVSANPETNRIKISHCILPSRMAGFDRDPLPYIIRDFHGEKGVTAFTEVPAGVKLTLARSRRNSERIVALAGEVVACEDTIFCRNTLTIQVQNVREFIRQAQGNHQVAVFGDYLQDLEFMGKILDCELLLV